LELQEPLPSPASSPQSDLALSSRKKKERKEKKETTTALYMDMSAGEETSVSQRESSLTRGYESLGAQFFSLADTPKNQKLTASFGFTAAEGDRPSSKTASRLRTPTSSVSAMAMDLGLGGEGSSTSTRSTLPLSAFRFDLKPLALDAKAPKMQTSQSMGALQVSRSKGSGLLPTLSPDKNSAQSIARTMQMSKTAAKWSVVGLRGSASVGAF
jgi:hypothetical protein